MLDILDKKSDIDEILKHRNDNGWDYWATSDCRLLKGSPFSTLESPLYLVELGLPYDDSVLVETGDFIFTTLQPDGRFKIYPTGSYPCHTASALKALCYLARYEDVRLRKTVDYFVETQEVDGGWKCNKYSFGRGEETAYSTPITTLFVLDCLRFFDFPEKARVTEQAIHFLLQHWIIKKPISPCHYGIGKLFNQVEYPFRGYNIFYYIYVLSFYATARNDHRFKDAYHTLLEKVVDGQMIVERVVPKLAKLSFCRKGEVSSLATKRWKEIEHNMGLHCE